GRVTAEPLPRGTGVPPVIPLPPSQGDNECLQIRQGAYLPHWTKSGGAYAVTFRLADSLPQEVLRELEEERKRLTALASGEDRTLTENEERRRQKLLSERIEYFLDQGLGSCALRDDRIGQLVEDSLKRFHGDRYSLLAWS